MAKVNTEALVSFQRDIEQAVTELGGSKIAKVFEDAAKPIEEASIRYAPERPGSGRLKASISSKVTSRRGRYKVTIGSHGADWGSGDYYPAFVEYGHEGPRPAPPHPYLRPAYDLHRDEAYKAIAEGIFRILREAGL